MADDDFSFAGVSGEPDEAVWADDSLQIPGDLFGRHASTDSDGPVPASSSGDLHTVPEESWGPRPEQAEFSPEDEFDEDWWLPRDDPDTVIFEPPPAAAPVPPGARNGHGPRPVLAPPPVAPERGRRSLDLDRRVVGGVLAALAVGGLLFAAVERDSGGSGKVQAVGTARVLPTTTTPTSAVPRTTLAPVTTVVGQGGPAPTSTEVPATTTTAASSAAGTTPGTVARSAGTTVAPATTQAPAPPPVTQAPATTAAPATTQPTIPETIPTTKRPRTTAPDPEPTPSTTVATTTTLPSDQG